MSVRRFDLLLAPVCASESVVPRNMILEVAWPSVAAGDGSVEKLILQVRQTRSRKIPHVTWCFSAATAFTRCRAARSARLRPHELAAFMRRGR
jgi:hypothetical protein